MPLTKPLLCVQPVHRARGGPREPGLLVQGRLWWDVSGGGGGPREQLLPEGDSLGGNRQEALPGFALGKVPSTSSTCLGANL